MALVACRPLWAASVGGSGPNLCTMTLMGALERAFSNVPTRPNIYTHTIMVLDAGCNKRFSLCIASLIRYGLLHLWLHFTSSHVALGRYRVKKKV